MLTCMVSDQISQTQSMVAKRGHTNGQMFISLCKQVVLNTAQQNSKNADARLWGDTCGDQIPETFDTTKYLDL